MITGEGGRGGLKRPSRAFCLSSQTLYSLSSHTLGGSQDTAVIHVVWCVVLDFSGVLMICWGVGVGRAGVSPQKNAEASGWSPTVLEVSC